MKTILFRKLHQRYAISFSILIRSVLFLILMLFVSYASEAQQDSNSVKIGVYDKLNSESIPFANVVAYKNGVQVGVATTDMDGRCTIKNLSPGKYDFKAVYVGYTATEVKGVEVFNDKPNWLNIKLKGGDMLITCCCFCNCYYDEKTENWWPKLWTPYREMHKEWKEKKERRMAAKAAQKKFIPPVVKENVIEEETDVYQAKVDSVNSAVEQLVVMEKEIKVYPNPSSGIIHVETDQQLKNLNVMNAEGKPVKKTLDEGSIVDLRGCANGIYYLTYDLNGRTMTEKITLIND